MEIAIAGCVALFIVMAVTLAVFTNGDAALSCIPDARLTQLAEEGNRASSRLLKMKESPVRFTTVLQSVLCMASGLVGAFFAVCVAPYPTDAVMAAGCPLPRELILGVFVVLIVSAAETLLLLFGVVIPLRSVRKDPEATALRSAGFMRFVSALLAPTVAITTAIAKVGLKMGGSAHASEEDSVSEEEIRNLVDRGTEKGILDDDESEMIRNVFEFGELTAGKITVHRKEVDMLSASATADEWEEILNETRHTIYPVYGESVDDIVGILDARDFFSNREMSSEEMLKEIVKPAYFVPETVKADDLLKQMKETARYFSVVVDEYGGILGIVTLHDLIEQLVGEMESEDEVAEAPDMEEIGERLWRVRGGVMLDDLNEALGLYLPTDEYDTFGGYVFGLYGSVPEDGSVIEVETDVMKIRADKIADHKLEFATVELLERVSDGEAADEE